VNKSAEQYLLLDDETKADLADGKYHDQRRGTFGRAAPAPAPPAPTPPAPSSVPASSTPPASAARPDPGKSRPSTRPAPARPRQPGTPSQRRLAVLYNQQGLRPDEIARKLGLTRYEVTQIILAARTQGKL
jgi:hypothetical protein